MLSVYRRQVLAGALDSRRTEFSLTDLDDLALRPVPHARLLGRCRELRENLTVHDAACVALAEFVDAVLVTGDARRRVKSPLPEREVPRHSG